MQLEPFIMVPNDWYRKGYVVYTLMGLFATLVPIAVLSFRNAFKSSPFWFATFWFVGALAFLFMGQCYRRVLAKPILVGFRRTDASLVIQCGTEKSVPVSLISHVEHGASYGYATSAKSVLLRKKDGSFVVLPYWQGRSEDETFSTYQNLLKEISEVSQMDVVRFEQ